MVSSSATLAARAATRSGCSAAGDEIDLRIRPCVHKRNAQAQKAVTTGVDVTAANVDGVGPVARSPTTRARG